MLWSRPLGKDGSTSNSTKLHATRNSHTRNAGLDVNNKHTPLPPRISSNQGGEKDALNRNVYSKVEDMMGKGRTQPAGMDCQRDAGRRDVGINEPRKVGRPDIDSPRDL